MIISIIIPAYNAEDFIDRCFASVYQTAPSEDQFEVIVVNDGSKDNTLALLNEHCKKHSNLKVLDQLNGGVSVARNHGISEAKGDYVLFLDADDELVEGALTKVCEYLSSHEPMDMLVTRQIRKTREKEWLVGIKTLEEHKRYNGVEAYKNRYVRTNAGGAICNLSFIRKHNLRFPEGVKNAEDTIFFGQFQVYSKSIVLYNLPLYRINMIEDSASRICDYTKLGNRHIATMHAVAEVKKSLDCGREQRAVFDYVVYQLLSNTIGFFVASKDLTYRLFVKGVDLQVLLPLDTKYMYKMKNNARFMNLSIPLFYFFSWFKNRN